MNPSEPTPSASEASTDPHLDALAGEVPDATATEVVDAAPEGSLGAADDDALEEEPLPRHARWKLVALFTPIGAVIVAGYIAAAFWGKLVDSHPLVLIALSPINRWLLLTTNELSAWSYYSVGMLRHLFPDPLMYLVGLWFGHRAIKWAAETYPVVKKLTGEDGRGLEDPARRKILYPLALLAPNNWVSLLAGASRLPFKVFITLNAVGTALRLLICRWLGYLLDDEITRLVDWVARYSNWVTLASIILVLAGMSLQMARGTGELAGLGRIEEIEE